MEGEKDDEKTEKESVKGGLAISVLPVSHPISLPGYQSRIPQYQFFLRKTKILSRFDSILPPQYLSHLASHRHSHLL